MKALFAFLGAIVGLNLGFRKDVVSFLWLSGLAIILLIQSYRKKMVRCSAVPLLLGAALSFAYNYIPVSYDGVETFSGIVTKSAPNYFILMTIRGRFYVPLKGQGYEMFDIVTVNGYAKPYFHANYESQFDFGEYLRLKGVTYELSPSSHSAFFLFPIRMREYAANMTSFLDESAAALYKSLLFAQKDSSSALLSNANEAGVSYLVSSSGIFYMGLVAAFRKKVKQYLNDRWSDAISLGFATLLLIFSMGKIGIIRAYVCVWLRYLNNYRLNKRFEPPEILSFAGLGMLFIDPFLCSDTGFLLGFGVSFTLFFCKPILKRFNKYESKILALLLIRIVVFPISVSSLGYRPLSFFYALILTPLSWIAIIIGYPCLIFHFGKGMLNGYASFYGNVLGFMDKHSPALPIVASSTSFYFIFYLALLCCIFFVEIGGSYLKNRLIIGIISAYSLSFAPVQQLFTAQVSFINVGQGDSILIRHKSSVVMIDTGGIQGIDMARDTLIPFLRKQRIYHIDCLIGTHGHYDHIGAKDGLMEGFKVDKYIDDPSEFPFSIGSLSFQNYNVYSSNDENEMSLVVETTVLGKRWLFTGDAGKETELKIIKDNPNLDIDILKLGHHGSSTSSCEEFLKTLTPEMAIISCGRGNKYKHPNDDVIERLERLNIPYRRTDLEGTITYFGFA